MIERLLSNIENLLPELTALVPRKSLSEVALRDLDKSLAQAAGFPSQAQSADLEHRPEVAPIRQKSRRPLRPVRPRRDAPLARPREEFWQALRELRDHYDRTMQLKPEHADLTLSPGGLAHLVGPLLGEIEWYLNQHGSYRFADLMGDWHDACPLPVEIIEALRSHWPYADGNLPEVPVIADDVRLFCKAVWDYGQRHGIGGKELLALPLTREGFEQFTLPLWDEKISDCWPACTFFESALYEDGNPLTAYEQISLPLPFFHWDEDGAERFQAFITGPEGVAALLDGLLRGEYTDTEIVLRRADKMLIDKVGMLPLLQTYAKADGEKLLDLAKLENHWESYFKELFAKFPGHCEQYEFWMMSTDAVEIEIAEADDLEFLFGYYDCWDRLVNDLPGYEFMEGEGVAELVADICAVYRREQPRRTPREKKQKETGYEQAA